MVNSEVSIFQILLFVVQWGIAVFLLFVQLAVILFLSDLEQDFINPIDFCRRINKWMTPELYVALSTGVLGLLARDWAGLALIYIPLCVIHGLRIRSRRVLFDPTTVIVQFGPSRKASFVRVVIYLIAFFFALFRVVSSLLVLLIPHAMLDHAMPPVF